MSHPPVARALALARAGHSGQAVHILIEAGETGDVDALMQLAVWSLAGRHLPRDFDHARALLRRAVAIGHVDGALMEIALTANGTGGSADWLAARRLLEAAARRDPVAAAQLKLIEQMAIDGEGWPLHPPRVERLSEHPRVDRVHAFLTPDECAYLASGASDLLEPASVLDPATGRRILHPVRRSHEMAFGPPREDLVVRAINLRIAAATGTRVDQGESLTVLRYQPGDEYRPHVDTIAGALNQRVRTVLVYLNGGFPGGETEFPEIGLAIVPRGGDAIVFDTLRPDGTPDQRARHAGRPVLAGVKWVATRWIRANPVDPWGIGASR